MIEAPVGILAFGSLIADPGSEIEPAIVGRKTGILTPFSVEFARKSLKRGGALTLVPVAVGGSPVLAQILILNISEQEAMDRLWRREINKVGQGGHYRHSANLNGVGRAQSYIFAAENDTLKRFVGNPITECRLGVFKQSL
jgi:hypothetical protein